MRVFIALDIPELIHQRLLDYVAKLQGETEPGRVRWTRPEGWHVTLKFVGETKKVEEITAELSKVRHKSFDITIKNTGFFTPRSPRVFYVGIDGGEALPQLAAKVDEATASVGIEKEIAKYSPHLTLARFGSGKPQGSPGDRDKPKMYGLKQLLDARPELAQIDFGTMTATEFFLYQSVLHPKGAQYTKIAAFALRG